MCNNFTMHLIEHEYMSSEVQIYFVPGVHVRLYIIKSHLVNKKSGVHVHVDGQPE